MYYLFRPLTSKCHRNYFQHNLDVQPDTLVIDICHIKFDNLFKVLDTVASTDLPHSGNARLYGQLALVMVLEPS